MGGTVGNRLLQGPTGSSHVEKRFSQCGPGITWELVRQARSQATSRPADPETLGAGAASPALASLPADSRAANIRKPVAQDVFKRGSQMGAVTNQMVTGSWRSIRTDSVANKTPRHGAPPTVGRGVNQAERNWRLTQHRERSEFHTSLTTEKLTQKKPEMIESSYVRRVLSRVDTDPALFSVHKKNIFVNLLKRDGLIHTGAK